MSVLHVVRNAMLSLAVIPALAGAQSPAQLRADSAFQRKDWSTAAQLYSAITRTDTTNGAAWFWLGASLEPQREYQRAADAYQRAASLQYQTLTSEIRASRSFARLNNTSAALDHLRKASAFGFTAAQAAAEPAFESLRSSAAYAGIIKAAESVRFPCRTEHTFDYWEGTFSATPWNDPDSPSRGTLTNSRGYDGCVFVEKWQSAAPGAGGGMSMVFYDKSRHAWRMIWNDDQNQSNDYEGEYRDGAMRFTGWMLDGAGKRVMISNVLQNVSPGVIRHIFSTSSDGGKTWNVQSDGRFLRQP